MTLLSKCFGTALAAAFIVAVEPAMGADNNAPAAPAKDWSSYYDAASGGAGSLSSKDIAGLDAKVAAKPSAKSVEDDLHDVESTAAKHSGRFTLELSGQVDKALIFQNSK